MRKTTIPFIVFSLFYTGLPGQDTVFHQVFSTGDAFVKKDGYHLVYLFRNTAGIVDTVNFYKFGAYYDTRINDIYVKGNRFICTYNQPDMIGYFIYEYQDNKWEPYMGGPLRFYGNSTEKFDAVIRNKKTIKLIIGEKSIKYSIDYINKLLTRQDK